MGVSSDAVKLALHRPASASVVQEDSPVDIFSMAYLQDQDDQFAF